ncbi:hypothetical protein QYE76_001048 [Lolium multiflorum]|uniref:Uncharacterized protein n=1 Tax=Lolium multiflorum TaxID=4521 RepID=A0AAD8VYZ5_LOLMU|nr:hypothetical protein QYE76_001048 [Lolium multiflorum]
MAVKMVVVSMEKPSGGTSPSRRRAGETLSPDLGFAMAAALEGNDKNDVSDKVEIENEPEKHAKNKKYTKEDFIAKKHGLSVDPSDEKLTPIKLDIAAMKGHQFVTTNSNLENIVYRMLFIDGDEREIPLPQADLFSVRRRPWSRSKEEVDEQLRILGFHQQHDSEDVEPSDGYTVTYPEDIQNSAAIAKPNLGIRNSVLAPSRDEELEEIIVIIATDSSPSTIHVSPTHLFTCTCFGTVSCQAIIVGPSMEKEGLEWKKMKKGMMTTIMIISVILSWRMLREGKQKGKVKVKVKKRGDDPGDDVEGAKPRKRVPAKVMWYAPIIPQLKRLFRNKEHAKLLRWHKEDDKSDGELRHPADGTQWRKIDREFKDFTGDARNLRFGLSTDDMNPFGEQSFSHSTWPVTLCIYFLLGCA